MPHVRIMNDQLGITWEIMSTYSTVFFEAHGSVHRNSILIKIQSDATVCTYLFTAKSLYMFRVSRHPSSGVLKTVTAGSGTGHTIKYKDKLE